MKELLNKVGLKRTPQRMAILEYLDGNRSHPSAEDIYAAVSARFPAMSFATVYNTLNSLLKHNRLMELTIDPARKRFDPNPLPHHHLICTSCGRIEDIKIEFPLDVPMETQFGFRLTGNHVEFYGICPVCDININNGGSKCA